MNKVLIITWSSGLKQYFEIKKETALELIEIITSNLDWIDEMEIVEEMVNL